MFMKYTRRLLRNLYKGKQAREDQDQRTPQPRADIEIEEAPFPDKGFVLVIWRDPRTVEGAPWEEYHSELTASPGFSVGIPYDRPEWGGILVRSHFADIPSDDHDGTVFIPYTSIGLVFPLTMENPVKPVSVSAFRQSTVPYVGTC